MGATIRDGIVVFSGVVGAVRRDAVDLFILRDLVEQIGQAAALWAWLEDRFCRSAQEICAHIASEFGLRYSHSGCIKLLARLDFEYRQTSGVHCIL